MKCKYCRGQTIPVLHITESEKGDIIEDFPLHLCLTCGLFLLTIGTKKFLAYKQTYVTIATPNDKNNSKCITYDTFMRKYGRS